MHVNVERDSIEAAERREEERRGEGEGRIEEDMGREDLREGEGLREGEFEREGWEVIEKEGRFEGGKDGGRERWRG